MLSGVLYIQGKKTVISILTVMAEWTWHEKVISVAKVAISHGEAPDSHHY